MQLTPLILLSGLLVGCCVYKYLSERSTKGPINENYFFLMIENQMLGRRPKMREIIKEIETIEEPI